MANNLSSGASSNMVRTVIIGLAILIGCFVVFGFSSQFFYAFERVEEDELGVQFGRGRIKEIVGPGVYTDFGLFVNIVRVSSSGIPFSVQDEELITKDKQRIGLQVVGDIFRPTVAEKETIRTHWAQYNNLYRSDNDALLSVQSRAQQAMKVCVGDRNFDDAVIGTARDELRICIDTELNKTVVDFGLTVKNLVVPDVILNADVQARLDEIVQSRLQTEKAAQDELKANAEASAEQARQEGEIRAEQSRIQEESRQQKTLAELEQQKIISQRAVIEARRANELAEVEAERAVIEAQKSNDLLAAQKDLEIQAAQALAAVERAKASVAEQLALAELYANHPGYLNLRIVQANASALNENDKIIFTPEGTIPTLVLPGPGIVPTIDTGQQASE